jgi:hypothetical protein
VCLGAQHSAPRRAFTVFFSQRITTPLPKTTFKATAEFGIRAHFATGWHFGKAIMGPGTELYPKYHDSHYFLLDTKQPLI